MGKPIGGNMEEITFNHPNEQELKVFDMESGEKRFIEKKDGYSWIQGKTVSLKSMR